MIVPIQYLRGVAALMVVYHHASYQMLKLHGASHWPLSSMGAAGVDIFFVISGFIMWVTTHNKKISPGQFLLRRFVRIVPLYWSVTLFVLALTLVFPQIFATTRFNPQHAMQSMMFWPVSHPILTNQILPFFIQGWTLNYEMFFYLIFAIGLGLGRDRKQILILISMILVIFVASGFATHFGLAQMRFYSSTLLLEFLFGIFLGWLYLKKPAISANEAIRTLLLGALVLLGASLAGAAYGPDGLDPTRALYWGLPAALVAAGAVFVDRSFKGKLHLILLKLGDSSYSLYLSHIITLPATILILKKLHLGFLLNQQLILMPILLLVATLAGWLTYIWVERPLSATLHNI